MNSKVMLGLAILAVSVLAAGVSFVRARGPGGDGVVSRIDWDGSEYLVAQSWNDWLEPYTVRFYFRTKGGDWGSFYIDHDSNRWRNCDLKVDEKAQTITLL